MIVVRFDPEPYVIWFVVFWFAVMPLLVLVGSFAYYAIERRREDRQRARGERRG
jgi:hypothetical protein